MKRREFIHKSLLGGTLAFGASPSGVLSKSATSSTQQEPGSFELEEMTFSELQEGMSSGRFTARFITEMYLRRIEAMDRQGPTLRSIIETNPDALAIADKLDEERRAKGARGPLHGIPILLKDNIDTADKMTTTAGSLALEESRPSRDSFVAQKLREAGAILLGKANLSEWANFRSTRSSSGWSGRGGQCRNPYALDRNPCGSSSGSGVATAANFTAAAIGTETDGSVVCPSNANGLVGIKPTLGLVSRAGIIPIAHSQDTAGPMTRTVSDGAILLGAMTGVDPRDPATAGSENHSHSDYTAFLDADGLRGARIGILRQSFGFHEKVDAALEEGIAEMKRRGAEIIDPVELPSASEKLASQGGSEPRDTEMEVLLYEFKADLNAYLEGLGPEAPAKSLAELIAFNEAHRDEEMPYFGQEIFLQAQEKGPLTSDEYRQALETNHRLTREEGIDRATDKHRLDAIVAPTGGPAWTTDLVNGDHFLGGSSSFAAVAGYPNITVPAGFVHGLPVGLSFFGRAWSEPTLIKLAYAFEQATKVRKPPQFLPTAEL